MSDIAGRQYYVSHKGRKHGPFSLAELTSRRLTDDMQVWFDGLPGWVPINSLEELRPHVRNAAVARAIAPPSQSWAGDPKVGSTLPVLPEYGGTTPPPPPRSAGYAKHLGVANIVLGSLGLIACPLSVLGTWHQQFPVSSVNDGTLRIGRIVTLVTLLLVSVPMIVAGVGLLRERRWGRTLGLTSATICLVTYAAMFLIDCVWLHLPLVREAREASADERLRALIAGTILGSVATTISSVAWHATTIVLLNVAAIRSRLR